MPTPLPHVRGAALLLALIGGIVCAPALSLAASEPTAVASPGAAFADVPTADDIDPAAFAEWVDGRELVIGEASRERSAEWVLWTTKGQPGHSGMVYGESGQPGVRHLRIGFTAPRPVGTVMVNGGGSLSVLKPGAPYPGDLDDDSHWEPALRLLEDGEASDASVGTGQLAAWILPEGTRTRALRFTTDSAATETKYRGWLGGALVTSERLLNSAVFATVSSRSNTINAAKLVNGAIDDWKAWENIETRAADADSLPVVSAEHPEWILLAWDRPVVLEGLAMLWAGFSAVEVQAYAGPAEKHPRDALEGDWSTVAVFNKIENGYPKRIWPNRLDFGRTVSTGALRIRIVGPPPPQNHGHLRDKVLGGRRVWLGEIWALHDMGKAPLTSIKRPVVEREQPKPPIAVNFMLKEPGYVTLVVEKLDGTRVRNLVSETFFPAGKNTAWWDGTDDLGRDIDAARHGLYRIPARFIEPGEYRVRGLVRGAITPVYEFSVYAPGNPPWSTDDHTGAWLANHSPPSAAAFVPAAKSPTGEPAVYLGAYVTEGPDGLAWVDLDGRKRGGKKWIGGNWTAAPFIAADLGPKADPDTHVHVGSVWETEKNSGQYELRITALTRSKGDRPVLKTLLNDLPGAPADPEALKQKTNIGGLAVHNGLVVVSLPDRHHLVFFNASDGRLVGQTQLADPRGLAFDARGRLLATSGRQLVRFAAIADPASIAAPAVLVPAGLLDEPVAIALDAAGDIYVSDRGNSHQVKVFSPDGVARRAVGNRGVPRSGPYDPGHMNNPAGIAVDSKGQLWVTETDFLPKRVSVWSPDGRLVRAFYGPGKYGGGGSLDSLDEKKFYYADEHHGSMEFELDWKTGGHRLVNVLYRGDEAPMKLAFRSAAPETALHFRDRRYFTNCYNSSPTGGHGTAFLFVEHEGVARPAAGMGRAADWELLRGEAFGARWPAGINPQKDDLRRNPVFFIWHDLNADAVAQPEEVALTPGASGGVTIMDDLSFIVSRLDGKTVRFTPTSVDPEGQPRYSLSASETLATGVQPPGSSGGDQALLTDDGWAVVSLGVEPFHRYSLSGAKDGVAKWSYPNLWPGLHASHTAPKPDHPGQLIGPTRLLGGLMKSRIGPLWAVNSNHGCVYIFTTDGLFVATVFEDMRQGKRWRMPVATRGLSLEGFTLGDENFWPSISQLPDGTVYLADGARSALVRLDGVNNLSRLPDARLVISKDDLERSRAWQIEVEAARQREEGSGVLTVVGRFEPPVVDGDVAEWPAANWVDIDKRGARAYFNADTKPYDVTGSVAVAGGKLYAAWRTGNPKLLANSGELPSAPFKTGGALDLMIGANPNADRSRKEPVHGDARLLVTQVDGKPRALLYRAVVPGTRAADRVPFSSPWRTITFDRVDDISAQVEFAAGKDGEFEISVPLDLLLLKPAAGMTILGDIGILRGEGNVTTARIYWANKATGITADVPSEAMLTPSLWGTWQFKPEQ